MSGVMLTNEQANAFFDEVDTSRDGMVSVQELVATLTEFGLEKKEIVEMFRDVDRDCSGKITREEFVDEVCKQSRREAVLEMFDACDTDDSGKISLEEMKTFIANKKIDGDRLAELFNQVDTDGSGSVDKEEFMRMMVDNF